VNEKEVLARYRALVRWVERERRRLEKTGDRKSQRYLRRARLLLEVDALTFRELVRELVALSVRRPRR
jgi:hypothetical protein